ncbi:MAG: sodium-translocating pyrophosphatase [Candidatus Kappaea frigidicola]|nr:sodium-translocating pyrophosphatase [Candidatus Kappaea frigidicola]
MILNNIWYLIIPTIVCFLGLAVAKILASFVMRQDKGNDKMTEVHGYIRSGAMMFMVEEVRVMLVALVAIGAIVWFIWDWQIAVSFAVGTFCSGLAGFIGMNMATNANVRTAQGATKGFSKALKVAFSGGAVMGISVGSIALLGLCFVMWMFRAQFLADNLSIESIKVPLVSDMLGGREINFIKGALIVSAYSMGASLVALFDRVGGGIYTKAADMAADMVGKVEENIPEDDARNPATIADNVGDNVGDVGGLGADLLESFVGAVISVIVIMLYVYVGRSNPDIISGLLNKLGLNNLNAANFAGALYLPILLVAGGIISSLIGILFVSLSKSENAHAVLMNGTRLSALLTAAISYFVVTKLSPLNLVPFWSVVIGLGSGILIGFTSEYFTSCEFKPVKKLAESCQEGAGVAVAGGLGLGMKSSFWPVLIISIATILSYQLGGLVGITYTALGMLSFVVMTVSVDTFGPIADNAGGISQMVNLSPEVREVTDELDSIGNTTAAIGKGFAIGSAAFAALGLIAAYLWSAIGSAQEVTLPNIQLLSPEVGAYVIAGLFLGTMVPYAFSSLLIESVSETADKMIIEIRRQFKANPGILKGEVVPDYNKCIAISSSHSLKKMVFPALIAVLTPLVIGMVLGRVALAGFLIGALLSALLLALLCANTGGALDNAKKYIETGKFGGKGSKAHAAAVAGDTFGDPLKDTVGPSLDILIKLMSVVSLLFASLFPIAPIFMK